MKSRKAPKVPIPKKNKPFAYFKENGKAFTGKSPMAPMKKKRLSK